MKQMHAVCVPYEGWKIVIADEFGNTETIARGPDFAQVVEDAAKHLNFPISFALMRVGPTENDHGKVMVRLGG